jgi:hypothetical protein
MSTAVLTDGTDVRTSAPTAMPLLFCGLASFSVGASAIHFAVTFEHFDEYTLYGVFFLVLSWAQLVWPAVLVALPALTWAPAGARPAQVRPAWSQSGLTPLAARRLRVWLWLGIAGNALVLVIYFSSRTIGLPIGPDTKSVEAWGGLDLVCAIEEILLIAVAAAVLARPGLLGRPIRFRSQARSLASMLVAPAVVIVTTTAVMTPAWAGSEGPAGMAAGSSSSSSVGLQGGMGDMGTTDGLPDMRMYGNLDAPTAAQVEAAATLVKETDASLVRYQNIYNAFAAGYTYPAATNGEEHLIYEGDNPAYQGLNPEDPSSLVYALKKDHMPILLGAMYLMPEGVAGPQIGGGLTRWHSHLEVCRGDRIIIAGFNFPLPGTCNPSTWHDQYTTQMLHVWVVNYPGGVFSDDLSTAATTAGAQAALAETKPGQLAP